MKHRKRHAPSHLLILQSLPKTYSTSTAAIMTM